MKILMVSAEFAPLVKTGGLADATAGLAGALAKRGHDVRVLVPRYAHLSGNLPPSTSCGAVGTCHIFSVDSQPGSPMVYLLDVPGLDTGSVYSGDERDAIRFIHLAAGAFALPHLVGWRPDLFHCHDWHAALLPELLGRRPARAETAGVPTILTIHNLGYQGVFPGTVIEDAGVPELETLVEAGSDGAGMVNFLDSGIRRADLVTTVSPTYAREIRTPEYGMGLEDLLKQRGDDLVGILNGVDYGTWDPAIDPYVEPHYDASDPSPKSRVKGALCRRFDPPLDPGAPLVGLVTRLVSQKGVDILIDALPALLEDTGVGFAVLGSGDPSLETSLRTFARRYPGRVAYGAGFDEPLAHQILSGSDMVLVPSRYEPCGLTQMYALRYGTIPVVRATGGLADTIRHFDPVSGRGNGSVFQNPDSAGLLWGVGSALEWFGDGKVWSRLVANAMQADFSWEKQVEPYEDAYRRLLESATRE